MIKDIDLGPTKKYNLTKIIVDLKNLNNSRNNSKAESTFTQQHTLEKVDSSSAHQIKLSIDDNNTLDKLCTPCLENKST